MQKSTNYTISETFRGDTPASTTGKMVKVFVQTEAKLNDVVDFQTTKAKKNELFGVKVEKSNSVKVKLWQRSQGYI